MTTIRDGHRAFGGPGLEPRWTRSDKDGVGTAYSASSRVWFTLSNGILNEIYYPTIDRPQIRDLQYLVTDGETFFHDEQRHLETRLEYLTEHTLGFRLTNTDREGRYAIVKEVIADPGQSCVLIHTRLQADDSLLSKLRLFALLAPHLEVGGWGNTGNVAEAAGREVLTAHKSGTWLALGASIPFARRSCGYVGTTDGWRDLSENFQMDWEFDSADDGNVALTGELDLAGGGEFTLGVAFGDSLHSAVTTLFQAVGVPFGESRTRYVAQWERACRNVVPLAQVAGDGGALYHRSHSLLLAHEDKNYQGALIASLSIPWGDARGDGDLGAYHLVWTRDMCNSATALLASGNTETPRRALIYLAASQQRDGGFHQNFWLDGEPYWRGVQLDEVAFPVLLAWHLRRARALKDWDPYPMVTRAAGYLIREGPATPQERWEENSGYSPSTLASNIAALLCAASFARERGENGGARYLEEYADFLAGNVERWTVTTEGTLVAGIPRHFIRIQPVVARDPQPDEDPNRGILQLRNQAPGRPTEYAANAIVDAGFLELVRYGVRRPGDPLVEDSLRVVDEVLRVETPVGPCWRRYNHDGYGSRDDGGPFRGWGTGRLWPLLTAERGHYELAAGRAARPFIRAVEGFASTTGLLPEQVWDQAELPGSRMLLGRPAGSAMPLMWAHAEYIKLLRSAADGRVFDLIPEVADRYRSRSGATAPEIWKFNRRVRSVRPDTVLRVQADAAFRLRWTRDEWERVEDTASSATGLGIDFVDIAIPRGQLAPVRFTFFWTAAGGRWEGHDYAVAVEGHRPADQGSLHGES